MNFLIRRNFLNDLASRLPRRLRFVIGAVVLTLLLLLTTFFDFDTFWFVLPLLVVATYFFTYFSVLEGINKNEWIVLFIMPVFFTVFMYFFYYLFPVRWLTRVPLVIFYGLSMYALLLTSNIFNVGVEKNIQLYRAAFSVNFLFQTLIVFLATEVLLSFRMVFILNAIGLFAVIFPVSLQLFWSVHPQSKIEKKDLFYAAVISLLISQCVTVLSFIPLKTTIVALFITGAFYSLGGLFYHYLDEKLFKQTIREYCMVMIVIIGIVLLTIQW
jgi:hypothetical protein